MATPTVDGRPWEGPAMALGVQAEGQVPPPAPFIRECNTLLLATAWTAPTPFPGGAVDAAPVLYAHFNAPVLSKGRALTSRLPE